VVKQGGGFILFRMGRRAIAEVEALFSFIALRVFFGRGHFSILAKFLTFG